MPSALLRWMDRPAERTALIDAASGRTWTFATLTEAVRRAAAPMVADRKSLVASLCARSVESVIGYLAALAAGHAVMLVDGESDPAATQALLDRYQPEFVLRDGVCYPHAGVTAGTVHAELAVLLSTSGSTGSPKLVRLSTRNLEVNAAQILEFLEIDATERAVQSLPIHHSYGLSVLNTHLLAGASVVLTRASIVRPEFWDVVRDYECTSFAGVPYAYEVLAKIGLEHLRIPSLRTLTQAGGRMPPARVLQFGEIMRKRGGRLVVMYGQTEATARVAYLPPSRVLDKPASIGIPVPRGALSLAPDGELIYEGPNVMLGYATHRADLARGDEQHGTLATGDLGRVDSEGYFSIVGRTRRIAKVCGERVNLDELESLLGGDPRIAVLEQDGHLVIVHAVAPTTSSDMAQRAGLTLGIPSAFIRVQEIEGLPRTSAGKTDYVRLARELGLRRQSSV